MQANNYITDTEPLLEHYTYERRKHPVGLERKCDDGLLEELGDVYLFQWNGKDCDGPLICA